MLALWWNGPFQAVHLEVLLVRNTIWRTILKLCETDHNPEGIRPPMKAYAYQKVKKFVGFDGICNIYILIHML
jgi:hypothetical protein